MHNSNNTDSESETKKVAEGSFQSQQALSYEAAIRFWLASGSRQD